MADPRAGRGEADRASLVEPEGVNAGSAVLPDGRPDREGDVRGGGSVDLADQRPDERPERADERDVRTAPARGDRADAQAPGTVGQQLSAGEG